MLDVSDTRAGGSDGLLSCMGMPYWRKRVGEREGTKVIGIAMRIA